MKNHWTTNCPEFLDGDKTAQLMGEVDCDTCLRKLQYAVVDGLVENYLESDTCTTCDGSGEVAGNYFAEDGMDTCPGCGGRGHGVVSDEFEGE